MFIKELAAELNKSTSCLSSYLKKHLPATLSKRKNSNNRLALFVDGDGIAGLRARYTPPVAPAEVPSELVRLQEENARLQARVAELEAQLAQATKPERKERRNAAAGNTVVDFAAKANGTKRTPKLVQEMREQREETEALLAYCERTNKENDQWERDLTKEVIRAQHACTLPEEELEALVDVELKRLALETKLKFDEELEVERQRLRLKRQFES